MVVSVVTVAVGAGAWFAFEGAEDGVLARERAALESAVGLMAGRVPAETVDFLGPAKERDPNVEGLNRLLDPLVQEIAAAFPGTIVGFYAKEAGIVAFAPAGTEGMRLGDMYVTLPAAARVALASGQPQWVNAETSAVGPVISYSMPAADRRGHPSLSAFAIRPLQEVLTARLEAALKYIGLALAAILAAGFVAFFVANRLACGLNDLREQVEKLPTTAAPIGPPQATGDAPERNLRVLTGRSGKRPGNELGEISESLDRSSRQLRELQEVSYDLSRLELPQVLMKRAVTAIARVLQTPKVFIALVDADDPTLLQVTESRGFDLDGLRVPVAGNVLGQVFMHRAPRVLHDALADPTFYLSRKTVISEGIRSGVYAPLIGRGGVLGVCGANDGKVAAFGEKEAVLLASLAGQISIALENAQMHAELHMAAVTDSLTGLYNRRYLEASGAGMGTRGPASLLMVDLDQFKEVNDQLGHEVGDEVLRQVAHLLGAQLRTKDRIVRFGGDEFLVLLPGAARGEAEAVAERIRTAMLREPLRIDDREVWLTVSVGVAEWSPLDQNPDPQVLLRWADAALYQAKNSGRNRVVVIESL